MADDDYPIAELPIIFGTHPEYRGNSTEFEWDVASSMQGKPSMSFTYLFSGPLLIRIHSSVLAVIRK